MVKSDYKYLGEAIIDFFNGDTLHDDYNDEFGPDIRGKIPYWTRGNKENFPWNWVPSNSSSIPAANGWDVVPEVGIQLISGTLFKTPEWAKRKN